MYIILIDILQFYKYTWKFRYQFYQHLQFQRPIYLYTFEDQNLAKLCYTVPINFYFF